MSDLLNSASLVMIPSGYKEDVVYSQIPTDGSGDLTFTRASNGTRVNSAGLVEDCPWNLVENSEVFALWNTVQLYGNTITVTDNFVTAPNGTLTAAKVVFATFESTAQIFQNYTLSPTQNLTATLYAKVPSGTKQAYFGFFDGSLKTELKTLTTEWQRIEYTGSIDAGTIRACWFYGNGGASNVEVHLWGGQLNVGSTAKPYFPTTDRLNVPRLTYQNGGGGCPSLLLEKQSTNLVPYSEQFDNAAWTTQEINVTANAGISPDGTQNADKITPTAVTGTHQILTGTLVSSSQCAFGVFAKADGYNTIEIYDRASAVNGAKFNILNGTIEQIYGSATATITDCGNGWYRCVVVATATGIRFYVPTAASNFTGDGTSGVYLWGAQLEASSYATSYIPTTSSSATRVADACFKTGISSLIGQTEGVIFWDGKISDVTGGELCDLNANGDKFIQIYNTLVGSTPTIGLYIQNVSVLLNNSNIATIAYNSNFKFALAYKNNDYVAYLNGVQVYVNTTIGVPATSNFSIGAYNQGNVTANKNTNQVALFKTRLTNAELASLTTL